MAKRYLKTYGVYGLLEWHASIPISDGYKLHVVFSGGSQTAYGVRPAEYSTSDVMVQHMIENSRYFKEGRISLEDCSPLGGSDAEDESPMPVENPAAMPEESASSLEVLKVACIDDARDYLVEHFGAKKGELRSRSAIDACGEKNGIRFEY